MRIEAYNANFKSQWNEFVHNSKNGTFLFLRDYMDYHRDRFTDSSLLFFDDKDHLTAILPANKIENVLISHGGLTYGGFVVGNRMKANAMLEIFDDVLSYSKRLGFSKLIYKPVPRIYHRVPTDEDLYALFINSALRFRCDLSCAVDLTRRPELSSRRGRSLKKALKAGVRVEEGTHFAAALWGILEDNLARKYEARPVHTLEEITHLQTLFSEQIKFVAASLNGEVVAGVVLFVTDTTVHAQYIASSETGYETSALDAVFNFCIEAAASEGKRYFDFGTSNEDDGRKINATLYNFKSEFGGGGIAHEFYELNLQEN